MYRLILASSSPRREDLLNAAGFDFDIEPSSFEEDMTQNLTPEKLAEELSLGKARHVAARHSGQDHVVLGGDSIVAFDGKVYGKPKDKADAFRTLSLLSGKEHCVITGITLIDTLTDETVSFSVTLKVKFKKLSEMEINDYIESGEPMDKGGSYAVQGMGEKFVEKTEGDITCAIGLPIIETTKQLKQFGVI